MRLLMALEEAVGEDTRKLYERGVAWFRLFRFWAGLRWGDTHGLSPASLVVHARGAAARVV